MSHTTSKSFGLLKGNRKPSENKRKRLGRSDEWRKLQEIHNCAADPEIRKAHAQTLRSKHAGYSQLANTVTCPSHQQFLLFSTTAYIWTLSGLEFIQDSVFRKATLCRLVSGRDVSKGHCLHLQGFRSSPWHLKMKTIGSFETSDDTSSQTQNTWILRHTAVRTSKLTQPSQSVCRRVRIAVEVPSCPFVRTAPRQPQILVKCHIRDF